MPVQVPATASADAHPPPIIASMRPRLSAGIGDARKQVDLDGRDVGGGRGGDRIRYAGPLPGGAAAGRTPPAAVTGSARETLRRPAAAPRRQGRPRSGEPTRGRSERKRDHARGTPRARDVAGVAARLASGAGGPRCDAPRSRRRMERTRRRSRAGTDGSRMRGVGSGDRSGDRPAVASLARHGMPSKSRFGTACGRRLPGRRGWTPAGGSSPELHEDVVEGADAGVQRKLRVTAVDVPVPPAVMTGKVRRRIRIVVRVDLAQLPAVH